MAAPPRTFDGVVLRLQPVGDADLIVSFLGPEVGRQDAFARSARSSLKRFGGRLELFVAGQAQLRDGRGRLPTLLGLHRHGALLDGAVDYPRLALASLVAELALCAAQPEQADPSLYQWLQAAVALCRSFPAGALREARLAVEFGWLQAQGTLPPLDYCGACGGDVDAGLAWVGAHDGARCRSCSPAGASHLDARDVSVLRAAIAGQLRPGDRLSDASARLLGSRAAGLLADHLSRPPRSAAALAALAAG
ncbi:MAG: DNA repair protein RecO [Deltaproteobacteria bacterium]|nr:DNA repair protein RecO [Deltaproteobacteria bacterium]